MLNGGFGFGNRMCYLRRTDLLNGQPKRGETGICTISGKGHYVSMQAVLSPRGQFNSKSDHILQLTRRSLLRYFDLLFFACSIQMKISDEIIEKRAGEVESLYRLSRIMNTGLNRRVISILLELLELGIHPDSLVDGEFPALYSCQHPTYVGIFLTF